MLLETKNIKENDFVIYSRNSVDEKYNYRIIFINDPNRHHRFINYEQVERLISEYFPKNLIAYRIVSNYPDLFISNAEHGFTILLNNKDELFFTDPVYAVKSMEEYLDQNPSIDFKFRVQKVGITTVNMVRDRTNFKEEFCFDMNIEEVVNQNDENVVNVLLKKIISAKKKKKFKSGKNENQVFTPEKKGEEKYVPVSTLVLKDKKTIDPEKFAKRTLRQAEGSMYYGDEIINLGPAKRLYDEVNEMQTTYSKQRWIDVKDFQVETISRNDQQSFRNVESSSDIRNENNDNDNLRSNYSDEKASEDEEFNKVKEAVPIVISKIGLDGEEMETPKENMQKKEFDELFSGFLNSLQSEPSGKSKKHRKRKEKDLLYLFKTLHAKENNSDKD